MLPQPLPILDRRGCGVLGGTYAVSGTRVLWFFIFFLNSGSIVQLTGIGIMQFLFI